MEGAYRRATLDPAAGHRAAGVGAAVGDRVVAIPIPIDGQPEPGRLDQPGSPLRHRLRGDQVVPATARRREPWTIRCASRSAASSSASVSTVSRLGDLVAAQGAPDRALDGVALDHPHGSGGLGAEVG